AERIAPLRLQVLELRGLRGRRRALRRVLPNCREACDRHAQAGYDNNAKLHGVSLRVEKTLSGEPRIWLTNAQVEWPAECLDSRQLPFGSATDVRPSPRLPPGRLPWDQDSRTLFRLHVVPVAKAGGPTRLDWLDRQGVIGPPAGPAWALSGSRA